MKICLYPSFKSHHGQEYKFVPPSSCPCSFAWTGSARVHIDNKNIQFSEEGLSVEGQLVVCDRCEQTEWQNGWLTDK